MGKIAKRLLLDWQFARLLQLAMGLTSLSYGIYTKDSIYIFVGIILLLQAVFNISFCGAAGCGTAQRSHRNNAPKINVKKYRPKF